MRGMVIHQTLNVVATTGKQSELVRVQVEGTDWEGKDCRAVFYLPKQKALDLGLALAGAV